MKDPIRLTADFAIGDDGEIIPAGTIGLPVAFGAPADRKITDPRPEANNFHFPTLSGSGPWETLVPMYSLEHIIGRAQYEVLNWNDKGVADARRAMHPWRSSDQDLDNMTQDEAVELVVLRLIDIHNAILGVEVERPDEPAWKTLVRHSPILSDYEVFVRQTRRATEQADEAKQAAALATSEAISVKRSACVARDNAMFTLNGARTALQQALDLLNKEPAAIVRQDAVRDRMAEQWLVTRDLDLTGAGRGTIKAGAIVTVWEGQLNALVTAGMWTGRSDGDIPLIGWDGDTRWYEERGLVKVWPSTRSEPALDDAMLSIVTALDDADIEHSDLSWGTLPTEGSLTLNIHGVSFESQRDVLRALRTVRAELSFTFAPLFT